MNNFDNLIEMIEKAQEKAFFYSKDVLKLLFQNAKTNKEKAVFLIAIGILEGKKYHNDSHSKVIKNFIQKEHKEQSFYHW